MNQESPRGAQKLSPMPHPPLTMSPLDTVEGQTQKDKIAIFIFLCNLLQFQKGNSEGQLSL